MANGRVWWLFCWKLAASLVLWPILSLQVQMKRLPIIETKRQAAEFACVVDKAVVVWISTGRDSPMGEYDRQAEAG
jgi:hypothetical protein